MFFENTCSNELLKLLKTIQNNDIFNEHFLVGGTALALQLGHRKSIDIDLFTLIEQDNALILEYLNENFRNIEIKNNSKNILQVFVNDIKVDFVKATGKLIEKPINENGIRLCHINDIAGMKLNVINQNTGRIEAKDYIDIAYLIKTLTLEKMFEIYKWKYDKTDVYNVKLDLLNVDRVNPYSWEKIQMLKKDIYVSDVRGYIKDAVENYNKKNKFTF